MEINLRVLVKTSASPTSFFQYVWITIPRRREIRRNIEVCEGVPLLIRRGEIALRQ